MFLNILKTLKALFLKLFKKRNDFVFPEPITSDSETSTTEQRAELYENGEHIGTIDRKIDTLKHKRLPFSVNMYSERKEDLRSKNLEKEFSMHFDESRHLIFLPLGFKRKRFPEFKEKVLKKIEQINKFILKLQAISDPEVYFNKDYHIHWCEEQKGLLYLEILEINNAKTLLSKGDRYNETDFWRKALKIANNLDSEKIPEIAQHLLDLCDEKAYRIVGDYYFDHKDYAKAKEMYETALDLNPKAKGFMMKLKQCKI